MGVAVLVVAATGCGAVLGLDDDGLRPLDEPTVERDGEADVEDRADGGEEAKPDAKSPSDEDTDASAGTVERLTVAAESIIAGALSLAADADGKVVLAWLDTPAATRHMHIARIAGGEDPPRLVVVSDTTMESNPMSSGQAVSVFAPSRDCFGVVWGQAGTVRVATVAADAKPGSISQLLALSTEYRAPFAQIRTASMGPSSTLVAWSEVARYMPRPTVFKSGELTFAGCAPGTFAVDASTLSPEELPPKGGAPPDPEFAVTMHGGAYHAAMQRPVASEIFGVAHRARSNGTWGASSAIDDAKLGFTAGGGLAMASGGEDLAVAYYRRTSASTADLVLTSVKAGGGLGASLTLERDLLIAFSPTTWLEAPRVAIVSQKGGGSVVIAAFARDLTTSELRVYRTDAKAPGGVRSEVLDTNVFFKGGGSPLVDATVDAAGRVHVAWRSGDGTKAQPVQYARLSP